MSIDQVELHEVAIATATRASETEWEGVHAWLDHAEVLLAAKRQYGYGGFGEWWSTMVGALPRAYGERWRSILLRAAQRCKAEGRPEMAPGTISGQFSLKRWANGGDGWTTDERTEPDVDLDDEYDGPVDDDEPEAESAAVHGKDEWYTPGWLFHALGLTFDLDACSPADRTYVSVPAHKWYTEVDDGLAQRWHGLVWCNPPYSSAGPWAKRMIAHGNGLLLTHVPINGGWCLDVWRSADALCLFQGMHFVRPDGEEQRPRWWLQLAAYGPVAAAALNAMPSRIPADLASRWRPGPVWGNEP